MMTSFLYTVAEDLHRRFGDELRHVAVVFNNKRPVVFLKKYLAELSGKPLWSPAMFTIQEFLAQSEHLVIADDLPRFFLLHEAYNELLEKEGKQPLSPDEFWGLSEIILRDFDQIDYELVDPRMIFQYLKDTAEIAQRFSGFSPEQQEFLKHFWDTFSAEKQIDMQQKFIELWKRLPLLYDLFDQKMKTKGLTGMAKLYRNLAERKAADPGFINSYHKIVFVGFNALNKCEATLFKQWQEAGKALFYFDADAYYFDDPMQEAGLFLRRNIKNHGLKNALGAFPAFLQQAPKSIAVYPVTGNISQAKALAMLFKNDSETGAENPSRRALILADESLLIPVLQTVPDEVKLNVTMGFPLKQSPVFGFIDLWLSIQEQLSNDPGTVVRKEDVISYYAHPLSGFDREFIREKIREINAFPASALPVSKLRPTDKEQSFFQKNQNGLDCIRALNTIIAGVVARKEQDKTLYLLESALLLSVNRLLNQLYDGLSVFAERLSVDLVISFIRKTLSGLTTPLEGEPLRGLQIMGMLESRCLDFDELIILGANEGMLPGLSLSPTFIPDALRRAYGLPVLENQDALSAYLFYRLLQRARKVSIVYNAVVDTNTTGEVSRFVRQLQFESGLKIDVFPQNQKIRLAPSAGKPLVIEKTPEVMAILKQYLTPGEHRRSLSASALKLYLQCPLQFFFQYVAGIKKAEVTRDVLDPMSIGNILHKVMEIFYTGFKGKRVEEKDIKERMKSLPELCLQALYTCFPPDMEEVKGEKRNSAQVIALNIVEENARLILNHDARQVAPFKIIELENKDDYYYGFPIEIAGKTERVNLYAIIDRVDEVAGQRRIVDYKTGGDQLNFNSIEELFSSEKPGNMAAFQALFYAMLYRKIKNVAYASPHLYILRKLSQEGTALGFLKGRAFNAYSDKDLEDKLGEFEAHLKRKLEELFDPAIPFRHNEKGKHYADNPYAFLCNAGAAAGAEEEE